MAIYTTQLRSIVEQCQAEYHVGPDDFTVAYARLGLDDYPIFDETYRQGLNDKIIRHFYFREIGEETVARFRWRIRATMWEQMPYYNQLYASLNLVTDPLTNVHYTYSDVVAESVSEDGTTSKTGSVARDATVTETHGGEDVTEEARGTTTTEELEHGHTVTEDRTHGHTVTEELEHGHTVTEDRTHGHTVTEELDHGRTVTETLQHGHVTDDSQVTNYGRTQATVNGGSDQTLDGKTSEREIKSDTPMNQITAGGVEALNYATEVTYTDREGTRAGTTTYGGTTNVTYGGADSTTGRTINSGTDTTTTGTTGTDTTTTTNAGTDTDTTTNTGTDTTTTTNAGTDTDTTTNAGTDTTTTTTDGADTTTVTHGHTVTTATDDDTATTESGTDSRDTSRDMSRDHERMGYDGISQSRLLEEFRKTFLNVDLRVLASLEPCFFGLWM